MSSKFASDLFPVYLAISIFTESRRHTMDATKKSTSQLKRETSQAKKEFGKRKAGREGGGSVSSASSGGGGNKRPKYSHAGENRKKQAKFGNQSRSTGAAAGAGAGTGFPPKQKKKIDKPKHLKRKLEAAQQQVEEKAEGAEQLAAELEEEQKQLELKKTEAKDKFYELCKTLVGVDKWDDEKQGIYDKLVQEKGCDKKKFLAALGVEEAKEKVKHRPDRAAPGKRKKISRAKKSALQQQKHAHDKNKIGVVIGHKHTTGGKKKTEGGTGAAAGKSD